MVTEPIYYESDDRFMKATLVEDDGVFVVRLEDTIHMFEMVKRFNVFDAADRKAKEWTGLI